METCSVIKEETDPGFDLFFSSNLEEMTDVPIYFENPLPTWLHAVNRYMELMTMFILLSSKRTELNGKMQTDKKKTM
jgi:hypothetical protein